MDTYTLSRNWFNFCFDNPEKIRPAHTAIYFFAIEHCNRLGWKEKFGFSSQMTMEALGIKKHQTYINYFNDLIDWGFFEIVQRSKNQWSTNIISLKSALPKKGQALDKAIITHRAKQGHSTGQSKVHIDKQINEETSKPINNKKYKIAFDEFRKLYPGRKRGLETEFNNFKKKHKDYEGVVFDLKEILKCQINSREMSLKAGRFTPEWKNLQTWINQRCWEEENILDEKIKQEINEDWT